MQEVEKRNVSISERLLNEKNYKAAVFEICKAINNGEKTNELIYWLNEIEKHIAQDNYTSNTFGDEFDFPSEESKLLQIKYLISDFEDKILKESAKNINTFVPFEPGETINDVLTKIDFYQKEIGLIRVERNKLIREKTILDEKLEGFEKKVNELNDKIYKNTTVKENEKLKIEEEMNVLNKKIKNLKYQITQIKKDISFLRREIDTLRNQLYQYKVSRNILPDINKIRDYNLKISLLKEERLTAFSLYIYLKVIDSVKNNYQNDYNEIISLFYKNKKIKSLIISVN